MRVITQYSLNQRALEIYVSGCYGNCIGCHNPEMKSFGNGEQLDIGKLKEKMIVCKELIDKVWILGGDPLDQPKSELVFLLKFLRKFDVEVWIWTRHQFGMFDEEIAKLCDYVKCGHYKTHLPCKEIQELNITLASNNQYIVKLQDGEIVKTY